ncbi:hypothetical protein ILYODFUR_032285 [Ilyodon furcidens]|uniref:Peptidoglycan binding-like domain-containing protein n=1 Tax=Ilyodon furcidens TaxID=33524 RepID=A0ABV0T262_9TELE
MEVCGLTSQNVEKSTEYKHFYCTFQQSYLTTFYTLSLEGRDNRGPTRRIRSASPMEEKVREMQNFFGLRETGILDSNTLDVMKKLRCGVPDVDNYSFYPYQPKWKNHTISYT